jgi:hypothetical protein
MLAERIDQWFPTVEEPGLRRGGRRQVVHGLAGSILENTGQYYHRCVLEPLGNFLQYPVLHAAGSGRGLPIANKCGICMAYAQTQRQLKENRLSN